MIPLPSQIKIVKTQGNRAFFELEGLYPGYGVTVGNSLRRVLLSSLEGAAITQAKIKGAAHEFCTLPGVMEDVVKILINLKKVRFKMFSDEPQTAEISVKGEKEVKAKDFKPSAQLKVVNPESPIAVLTKSSAELKIEVKVEKAVGYQSVEKREIEKPEVGALPLDAIFTPVTRVNFSVENMRVGKRTDFDKLKLDIETDGAITPQEALKKSARILLDHFSFVFDNLQEESSSKGKGSLSKKPKASSQSTDAKKLKIEELDISDRTKNALLNGGLKTVGGLIRKSEESLSKVEGLGEKGIEELKKALAKLKVSLK